MKDVNLRNLGVVVCSIVIVAACSGNPEARSQDALARGDRLVARGSLNDAIVEYRKAVQLSPRSGPARRKLADAYFKNQNIDGALSEFVAAADLLPTDIEAQLKASEISLLVGRFDDARGRAEKVLAIDPKNVEAQIVMGNAMAGLKDLSGAIEQLEAAIRADPSRGASYANLGGLQVAKGDLNAAEVALKKAVGLDPQSVVARLALANLYWATERKAAAETLIQETLKTDPKNVLGNRALSYLYFQSGRVAEAEGPLKVLAESRPGPDGSLALADYYILTSRLDDAKALLQKVAQEPDARGEASAKLRLASLGLWAGNRDEAYRLLDEVLSKDPRNAGALVGKAQLLTGDGKLQEALTASRAAVAADPGSPLAQFVLGKALTGLRQYDGAAAAHQAALRVNSGFAASSVELARLALLAGKPDSAILFAQDAIRVQPGFADAHLLLAHAQIAKGNPGGAEASIKLLVTRLPESPAVQGEYGKLLLAKGDAAGARAAFDRALAKDPVELNALEGLVALELQQRKPAAARARIDAAVAAHPNVTPISLLAARTYVAVGDDGAAERMLKTVLAADPNEFTAYAQLASLYVRQKKVDAAIAEFDKSAALQPRAVEPRTAAGILLHVKGDLTGAQSHYTKALEIDRTSPVAANNLAQLYADRNEKLDVALQLAQTAKAGLPGTHEVDDTLGWVYYKKGNASMAVTSLRQAVKAQPNNAVYQYHLGAALALNKDKINARQALDKALKLQPNFPGADDARKILDSLK